MTRFGFKPVLFDGLLFVAGGLFWFSRVPAHGGTFVGNVLGPSLLAAIGLGLSFVPVTIAAVTGTRPHEAGLASGLVNTAQQVGARSAWRSSRPSPTAARRASSTPAGTTSPSH